MEIALKDKIRILRTIQNLTQATMAEKLDLSVTAYQDLENGETQILSKNLTKILDVFNMNLLEFLSLGEKGFIYLVNENGIINSNNNRSITLGSTITHRDEKEVERLEQIIELQRKRINDLENMVELLKNQK